MGNSALLKTILKRKEVRIEHIREKGILITTFEDMKEARKRSGIRAVETTVAKNVTCQLAERHVMMTPSNRFLLHRYIIQYIITQIFSTSLYNIGVYYECTNIILYKTK